MKMGKDKIRDKSLNHKTDISWFGVGLKYFQKGVVSFTC